MAGSLLFTVTSFVEDRLSFHRTLYNKRMYCDDKFATVTKHVVERCSSYSNFVEQRFRCITVQLQGFVDALKRREQVTTTNVTVFTSALAQQAMQALV